MNLNLLSSPPKEMKGPLEEVRSRPECGGLFTSGTLFALLPNAPDEALSVAAQCRRGSGVSEDLLALQIEGPNRFIQILIGDLDKTIDDIGCLHWAPLEAVADGDFEAVFDLWQVTYKKDMKIWGWMDAPSEKFTFSTCDPDQGQQNNKYTNEYYYGTNYSDLLNYPSKYIFENDWVIQDPYTFDSADAEGFRLDNPVVEVTMDFQNGVEIEAAEAGE